MDTVLVVVTVISLALAGGMSVLVAKMLREERRRSDARVAALVNLAADADAVESLAAPDAMPRRRPAVPAARETDSVGARRQIQLKDLEIRPAASVAVAGIFEQPERRSPWGPRLAVIGVLTVVGAGILLLSSLRGATPADGSPAARPSEAQAAAPLELVSMRHTQERDILTISGVVQNPKAGAALTRVSVAAVAFGPDGAQLATGRAPLDYTSLGAGYESPFVVTIPVHGTVARYRVGFRSEDGAVVAHVDRRTGDVSRAGM